MCLMPMLEPHEAVNLAMIERCVGPRAPQGRKLALELKAARLVALSSATPGGSGFPSQGPLSPR